MLSFVRIISVRNVKNEDFLSKSDPYCVVRIGVVGSSWASKALASDALQWRSETVENCLDPVWNMAFSFDPDALWIKVASLEQGIQSELEVHVRVYDDDVVMDDYLGEAISAIPKVCPQESHITIPITNVKNDKSSSLECSFFTMRKPVTNATNKDSQSVDTMKLFNIAPDSEKLSNLCYKCTQTGGPSRGFSLCNTLNKFVIKAIASMSIEKSKFLENLFQSEASKIPDLEYYLFTFTKFATTDINALMNQYSKDGGKTATNIFGSHCMAYLDYNSVAQELKTYPDRLRKKEIFRGNDFIFRLNSKLWEDLTPQHMSLGATLSQHEVLRPIMDKKCSQESNRWSSSTVYASACELLDGLIAKGQKLTIEDISIWETYYTFKAMLNKELSYETAKKYTAFKTKCFIMSILPACFVEKGHFLYGLLEVEECISLRKQFIEELKVELKSEGYDKEGNMHMVCAGIFDALFFAGGQAQMIQRALAVMYQENSPCSVDMVNKENVLPFMLEVFRMHELVSFMSYYTDAKFTERRMICMATANKDPTVWGANAHSFVIRDMSEYKKLFFFSEPCLDTTTPANHRVCPGADLSRTMIHQFLIAFIERKNHFSMNPKVRKGIKLTAHMPYCTSFEFDTVQSVGNSGKLTLKGLFDMDSSQLSTDSYEEILSNVAPGELSKLFNGLYLEGADSSDTGAIVNTDGCFSKLIAFLRCSKDSVHTTNESSGLLNIFSKLDNSTKLFYKIALEKLKNRNILRKSGSSIAQPMPRKQLEFLQLEGVQGVVLPVDDEDWLHSGPLGAQNIGKSINGISDQSLHSLIKYMQWNDSPVYFQGNEESMLHAKFEALLKTTESETMCNDEISNKDFVSDAAMSRIAFFGLGQCYIKRSAAKNEGYVLDLTHLAELEVRPGFDRYGVKALFDIDRKLMSIYVCSLAQTVTPTDGMWEHAKWAYKISIAFAVTTTQHLVHSHWIVANCLHIACRSTLNDNHPIRKVMKVFNFNTGAVNGSAVSLLVPENGLFHRMTGLTYDGVLHAFNDSVSSFQYEPFPEYLEKKCFEGELKQKSQMYTDALPLWETYHKFFSNFVSLYYKDETALLNDVEMMKFWECVDNRGVGAEHNNGSKQHVLYGLPKLSKAALTNYLTHVVFYVTAWHEFVAALYTGSSIGLCLKQRSHAYTMDVQTYVQIFILHAMSAMKNPDILNNNWRYLLPEGDEVTREYQMLMNNLKKISTGINERKKLHSAKDFVHVDAFNPMYHECSISL